MRRPLDADVGDRERVVWTANPELDGAEAAEPFGMPCGRHVAQARLAHLLAGDRLRLIFFAGIERFLMLAPLIVSAA